MLLNGLLPNGLLMVRLLLVDNADSFTFMLADYLRVAGAEVRVERSDLVSVDQLLASGIDGVVISPGPGRPEGRPVAIATACIALRLPWLGVCLGHQAIALACGGSIERVAPVHGKTSTVHHDGSGLFASLPASFEATRYHSLAVSALGNGLIANAWSRDDVIMGLRHCSAPAHGVQFHPESIASEAGATLLAAFVEVARAAARQAA